jgi:hypothetical protein
MDLRGNHMKMFALISIFTMCFACTVTAADVGVTATGQTQIATLKWARDMGYQVGAVKGTTVYCNTVTSFRSGLPQRVCLTLSQLEAAYTRHSILAGGIPSFGTISR